jgi:hypothetical protein
MITSKRLIVLSWLGSAIALLTLALIGPMGWDAQVYWKAIQSLRHGGDPYAEGIAAQKIYHAQIGYDEHIHPPMTYVYAPITLPLLRALGVLPGWLLGILFAIATVTGLVLQLWAGWQMATPIDRRWLAYLLPAVPFFPGLLNHDVVLSGNIAYLLYGLILGAAVRGWQRNRWGWYYLAVLAASICKMPLLTLLAFPVLVGKRQWLPSCVTGAIGSLLFLAQMHLWPSLFHEYLDAVQLQFDWNRDFGFSPAGLLGHAMVGAGKSYSLATTLLYLGYAVVLGLVLLRISWRLRQKADGVGYRSEIWLPLAIVGTVLLNPRIKEYDVSALTVPMLLIANQFLCLVLRGAATAGRDEFQSAKAVTFRDGALTGNGSQSLGVSLVLVASGWFLTLNLFALEGGWKNTELIILLALYVAGTWTMGLKDWNAEAVFTPEGSLQEIAQG